MPLSINTVVAEWSVQVSDAQMDDLETTDVKRSLMAGTMLRRGAHLPIDPVATPYLTVPQAGEWLGLGRNSAYVNARSGHLPTIKLSERRVVVPTVALLKLLGYEL